jgi:CBS-domain-containing membrane protein
MKRGRRRDIIKINRSVRTKLIPALLTAISLAILIFILHEFSIGIEKGIGSSVVIFASFAASAFILFMAPHTRAAKPSKFIKGYIIGGVVGYSGFLLSGLIGIYLTVFIAMFVLAILLVVLDAEHPPAAGITLAFLLYGVGYLGIFVVIIAALTMLLIRFFLENLVYRIEEDFIKQERKPVKK